MSDHCFRKRRRRRRTKKIFTAQGTISNKGAGFSSIQQCPFPTMRPTILAFFFGDS